VCSFLAAAGIASAKGGHAPADVPSPQVASRALASAATRQSASAYGYHPIRKVHAQLYTWNGNWRRNRLGLSNWWGPNQPHEKAIATLKRKIDRLAAGSGVRYFVLHLPGGSVPPRMCASQFWPMPKVRRSLLKQMAQELKTAYRDIHLGVYCGWGLDPTPKTTEMTGWRYPDLASRQDRDAIVNQYRGWHTIGFDFLVLDAISAQQARHGTATAWLRFIERACRLRTVGEAFPLRRSGSRGRVDNALVNQHAWMALKRFIDRHQIAGDWVGARYMGLNGQIKAWKESQAQRLAIVSDCVARGFVPWIYEYGTPNENVQLFKHAVDELARKEGVQRHQRGT